MKCRFFLFAFIFFINVLSAQRAPLWTIDRPKSDTHLIGIGSSVKTNANYKALAKANALNDLATEISANISSDLIDIMIESNGVTEEYARSEIRLSTMDELEGYEFFDDHDGKSKFSVYYRIPKDEFKRYADNAINAYDDYLSIKGEDNISLDLTFLISSLEYIYRAAGQDVYHNRSGKNLRSEVPILIKSILSNIEISTDKNSYNANYGREIKNPINVQLKDKKNSKPISDMDLEVRFERGDGQFLRNQFQTDRNGQIKLKITQIDSKEEQQLLRISVNLVKFKMDINKSSYLDNLLKGMARSNGLGVPINVSEFQNQKVAVLVVGDGLSPVLLSSLISKFNNEYKNQTDFDLMDPREAENILEREGFNIKPCTTYECQVEIGQKLSVDNLIFIKISYLRAAKILNISTVNSKISTKRIGITDDLDLQVKRGQTPDEVIINNVPRIVSSFWNKSNPATIRIDSSIPSINVEIINQENPKQIPEQRTTPFEIELPPANYNLLFNKIGYVSKNQLLVVNKSDRQNMTVELSKKNRWSAFGLSLLIPGSGQLYSTDAQNPSRARMAKLFRWGLLTGVAASGYAWYNLDQSTSDYEAAKEAYLAETTIDGINDSRKIAEDKNLKMANSQKLFKGSLALIGIIWTANAFDALLNFPDYSITFSYDPSINDVNNPTGLEQATVSFNYKF
jgi:hypothetical protein